MKTQIKAAMEKAALDFILLYGKRLDSPDIYYLLPQATLNAPYIIIPKNGENTLIYEPMERDEALASDFNAVSQEELCPRAELLKIKDEKLKFATFFNRLLERFHISGKLLLAGVSENNLSFLIRETLSEHPEIQVADYSMRNLFRTIRRTKDPEELQKLRVSAASTVKIFAELERFLSNSTFKGGVLYSELGAEVTIGTLRTLVYRVAATEALLFDENPIIALGRDGACPHSRGTDSDRISQGVPIVIDLSPKSLLTGYYADMTRTFAVGQPSDSVIEIYDTVKEAYDLAIKNIALGVELCHPDRLVNEFFRAKGHPVVLDTPGIRSGYVHSLGHGIGLEIHELPSVSAYNRSGELFEPNIVFTVEPGLYYDELEFGVRLEDSLIMHEDGSLETITEYPMHLIINPK